MNTTTTNAVTITGSGRISAFINGRMFTIDTDHPNYAILLDAVKNRFWDKFVEYADVSRQLNAYLSHGVSIKDGVVSYNGEEIHNSLTKKIISFVSQDLPFEPLVKFLENLLENPSKRSVDQLYDFLEAGELPITEDGCFLAFKNVKSDYKDIHSGTYDNSVGAICEMPRWKVDEDKDRTCSSGLHFCSISYLPHFSDSCGGHTMIVKINPKDVVSIPADYNNTKGRCCRYEVVGEYTDDWRSKIDRGESGWDGDLYDEDGNQYEDEDEDEESFHNEQLEEAVQDYRENVKDNCCGGSCHNDSCRNDAPSYHNLRDNKGRFTKKDKSVLDALRNFFGKK